MQRATHNHSGCNITTTTPPSAAAAVVVVLGSCSAAYVVLVLPLFCELSTIQVRKVLLIYDDRHAFSSIPESLCLKEISLYTSIIAQVTTILRIFFEYKYTDDDVYEKSSNSVRCTSKFNFNVLPV